MLKQLGYLIALVAVAALIACGSAAEAPPQPTPTTASTNPTPAANTSTPAPATATPPPTKQTTNTPPPDTPTRTPTSTPKPTSTPPPAMIKTGNWLPIHRECTEQYLLHIQGVIDELPEEQAQQLPEAHQELLGVETAKEAKQRLHQANAQCRKHWNPIFAENRKSSTDPTKLPAACLKASPSGARNRQGWIGETTNGPRGQTFNDILERSYPQHEKLSTRNGRTHILPKAMFILMNEMPHTTGAGCWLITSLQPPTFFSFGQPVPNLTPENAFFFMTAEGNSGERRTWHGLPIQDTE